MNIAFAILSAVLALLTIGTMVLHIHNSVSINRFLLSQQMTHISH
jgi:hypothetical protein